MMRKYILVIVVFLGLLGCILMQHQVIKEVKAERNRLSENQSSLLLGLDTFRTKDGLHVAKIHALTLKVNEFKKYRADDAAFIKSLNIDLKRLNNMSKTSTETNYHVEANLKDSFPPIDFAIYKDSIQQLQAKLKCIDYSTKWMSLNGCFDSLGRFSGDVQHRDSLVYLEYIIPKRALGFLWKYGCRERRQEIISKNPYTKIISVEFLSIKK